MRITRAGCVRPQRKSRLLSFALYASNNALLLTFAVLGSLS